MDKAEKLAKIIEQTHIEFAILRGRQGRIRGAVLLIEDNGGVSDINGEMETLYRSIRTLFDCGEESTEPSGVYQEYHHAISISRPDLSNKDLFDKSIERAGKRHE